ATPQATSWRRPKTLVIGTRFGELPPRHAHLALESSGAGAALPSRHLGTVLTGRTTLAVAAQRVGGVAPHRGPAAQRGSAGRQVDARGPRDRPTRGSGHPA